MDELQVNHQTAYGSAVRCGSSEVFIAFALLAMLFIAIALFSEDICYKICIQVHERFVQGDTCVIHPMRNLNIYKQIYICISFYNVNIHHMTKYQAEAEAGIR